MKVVYDTCLYIDLLRSGDRLSLFRDRNHIRYLSPIVVMELMAGARTPKQRKIVDQLIAPYSKAKRLLFLSPSLYYKAGECLAKLPAQQVPKKGFSHDLLIALSALSIGATLFTSNKDDFARIRRYIPITVEYL